MKQLDLRDVYPEIYKEQTIIMVSDDVWYEMEAMRREQASSMRKKFRYNANYSLDADDGIEGDAIESIRTPEELIEDNIQKETLYSAVMQLPEKQAKRIYARYYLGMTTAEIARVEQVDVSRVRDSIRQGKKKLKEKLKNF